ncbi:MAG: hypothetical protein ACOX9R_18675 [Armatimonadota bacterium]|jgi:hypothetical protein
MIEVISGWLHNVLLPGFSTLLIAAGLGLVRQYVQRLKDERLRQLLLELVLAAEQIYGPGNGEAKRSYVMERLSENGYANVAREQVEAMVFGLGN